MDSTALPSDEPRRLRCRLCFHAGSTVQLVEVFSKTHDLSKRVLSALGVKINRSEKQARICVVCETLLDIIQSFQAVCKQTNQLHHDRKDFLLYETFWSGREVDAVRITERMILNHRSEVDRTISGSLALPASVKSEADRALYPAATLGEDRETEPVQVKESESSEKLLEEENKIPEILKTEMVLCEGEIKDEPEDACKVELQPELEEPKAGSGTEDEQLAEENSDFNPEGGDSASTEPEVDEEEIIESSRPRRGRRKRKISTEEEKVVEEPRRRGRKKKLVTPKKESDDDDEELEPKVVGKRGPRRKKVRKSDPSVCDICGQMVAYFVKESHRNQHLGVRPYKCEYQDCGRSYFSQNDLRTHSKRHQITYHVCEICGRNIKGIEWFRRHVKTHTEVPQFTCEVCGSKFRRKAQLQTHMVTHTGLTPHECEICGKRFALKYNLDSHVKRHLKKDDQQPAEKPEKSPKEVVEKRTWKYYVKPDDSGKKHHVTCETCGKSVHKREMEGHVNKHLDRRPYSCDEPGCMLSFYGLRGIKEHKMVVHSDKVLRYECSICNRSIKGAGTFKRHVMMHNSDMKVECKFCGKKFTSKSYLKAHEQKHSGERPFVCEICGRSFAMKPCWKMHMKTVHNQDRREPTRVRKQKGVDNGDQQDQQQVVEVPLPVEGQMEVVIEQSSSSSVPLNVPTVEQQQYPTQQEQVPPAQILIAIPVGSGIVQYAAPDSVRTDYSY